MKVIGIDPAPSKESTIFDGTQFVKKTYKELEEYLKKEKAKGPVLICWDAPLSGPHHDGKENLLATRPIENFFMQKKELLEENDRGLPAGVSIRGYSGCSHWAISRALLGLPQVGGYDTDKRLLPFKLYPTGESIEPLFGPNIVEVHPAIAIWLWCKDKRKYSEQISWKYKPFNTNNKTNKEDAKIKRENFEDVRSILECGPLKKFNFAVPKSDDQLDALVAYALGYLWWKDKGEGDVIFLGDKNNGGFLVPNLHDIQTKWEKFKHPNKIK